MTLQFSLGLISGLGPREIFETWVFISSNFFRKPILVHDLEFFLTLAQYGCLRPGAGFVRLINQNITSIGTREKMEDLGEKMKTHVSKISPGSQTRN